MTGTENGHKRTNRLGIAAAVTLVWLLFLVYFVLMYYPSPGNAFDFVHMSIAVKIADEGSIGSSTPNIGYYVSTVVISDVSGIPFKGVPTLCLMLLPFSILLVALLRRMSGPLTNGLIAGVALAYLLKFGNVDAVSWWTHGIGFSVALLILYFAGFKSGTGTRSHNICIILMIIALNLISYKMMLFAIAGLVGLIFAIRFIAPTRAKTPVNRRYFSLIAFSAVYVLAFNQFVYSEFIPRIQTSGEITMSGLGKLLAVFAYRESSPLSTFYFSTEPGLFLANLAWTAIVASSIIIWSIWIVRSMRLHRTIHERHRVFISILVASCSIFAIYSAIGAPEITLLLFCGMICYSLIFAETRGRWKWSIYVIVVVLLALDVGIATESDDSNLLGGTRHVSGYDCLDESAAFYVTYFIEYDSADTSGSTDVFTHSYFALTIANAGYPFSDSPLVLSESDVSFLLGLEPTSGTSTVYIVNYDLTRFYAENWITIESWNLHTELLDSNQDLSSIYSCGDLSILVTNRI